MTEFFGQEVQVVTVSVPVGTIVMYGGDVPPNDWMFCQGQRMLKTEYAALHAALGVKYGSGDGSGAEFNLPDLRARMAVGSGGPLPQDTHVFAMGETGGTGGARFLYTEYRFANGKFVKTEENEVTPTPGYRTVWTGPEGPHAITNTGPVPVRFTRIEIKPEACARR